MNTDTPRTDNYAAWGDEYQQQRVVPASFARELERELAAERARADAAETDASLTADQNNLLLQTLKERCCERDDLEAQVAALEEEIVSLNGYADMHMKEKARREALEALVATLREALYSCNAQLQHVERLRQRVNEVPSSLTRETVEQAEAALAATESQS